MTRRSIVHLTTFLQGGAGRAIADLACAQHAAGHDVLVVTSRTSVGEFGNYPYYLDRLAAAGVQVIEHDSLFARDRAANLRVLDVLNAVRSPHAVDVVHAHAAVPATIGLEFANAVGRVPLEWRVGRVPRSGRARDIEGRPVVVQTQHGWGTNKTADQARHDLDVLDRVDRVVVTSTATGAFLHRAGVAAERITVLPCGIDPRPAAPTREALDTVARLRASGAPLIGCIGSVTENKNQALVVRALTCAQARGVHALFIGEGGEALLPLARELGVADRVHVVGYRPDADRWLGLLDLLVVPSRTEGQGLVVLEAFRAGVPVVASGIAALRELVVEGETGWLFASDDASALAATMTRALAAAALERRRIIEGALWRFAERYTTEVMVARHAALYEELCAAATRRISA